MSNTLALSVHHLEQPNKKLKEVRVENPFDSTEAVKQTGTSIAGEAGDLLSAARSLEGQARLARKQKNWGWMKRLEGLAKKLLEVLWDFTKKAFMLSVFNFIVDICSMVLSSAMESLTKHKTAVNLAAPAAAATTNYNDPFSRQYGSTGTTMSW
jgi:NTP pyrophosphatase (non-canonical NTP hydrolase)